MSNKWIRKGDKVLVIKGNDKGKDGEVLSRSEERIVVQGINLRKKHLKKTQQGKGQIVERESSIHISNVAPCGNSKQKVKLTLVKKENGEKNLVYKDDSGKEVLFRKLKKGSK
jgi:large subunit ribosomal protein L24